MAIEESVLNFIIKVSDQAASSTMNVFSLAATGLMKSIEILAKATKNATTGFVQFVGSITTVAAFLVGGPIILGLHLLSMGLNLLVSALTSGIQNWVNFVVEMEAFRKETGMTQTQVGAFRREIVQASREYMVSLVDVGNVARQLAMTTGGATAGVADLAAHLVLLKMATGQSNEGVGEFGVIMKRVLGQTDDAVKQWSYGISVISKEAGIPAQEITEVFNGLRETLGTLGLESRMMTIQGIIPMIAAMRQSGMTASSASSFITSMLDTTSDLGKIFVSSGENIGTFLNMMEGISSGAISTTVSSQALATALGAQNTSLIQLSDTARRYAPFQQSFYEAIKTAPKEIQEKLYAALSPIQKLQVMWTTFQNTIAEFCEVLIGENLVDIENFANSVTKAVKEFAKSEELKTWIKDFREWAKDDGIQKWLRNLAGSVNDMAGSAANIGRTIRDWKTEYEWWAAFTSKFGTELSTSWPVKSFTATGKAVANTFFKDTPEEINAKARRIFDDDQYKAFRLKN
jgi:hypothetical protein